MSLPPDLHATLQPSSFCLQENTSGVLARGSTSMMRADLLRPPALAVCGEASSRGATATCPIKRFKKVTSRSFVHAPVLCGFLI